MGKHVIWDLDAEYGLNDPALLLRWLQAVVDAIDMEPLGEPVLFVLDNDAETGPGITAMQAIATSHIAIHTFPDLGTLNADVFSCKWFDHAVVERLLDEWFCVTPLVDTIVLERYGGPFGSRRP